MEKVFVVLFTIYASETTFVRMVSAPDGETACRTMRAIQRKTGSEAYVILATEVTRDLVDTITAAAPKEETEKSQCHLVSRPNKKSAIIREATSENVTNLARVREMLR